jgi:DNA-binding GntR family transcriptional regulator
LAKSVPAHRVPMPAAATRTERLRLKLEAEILVGNLRPGEKLDEKTIARRFGLSRTPVREAFKALASSGMVEVRPHHGAYVSALTLKNIIEMFEVMIVLESACAELAARRLTLADQRAIRSAQVLCETARQKQSPSDFYQANAKLHEAIYRSSHNEFLMSQTLAIRQRLEPYRRQITYHPGLIEKSNEEHEQVIAAIFEMDADSAAQAMRIHLANLRDNISVMVEAVSGERARDRGKLVATAQTIV